MPSPKTSGVAVILPDIVDTDSELIKFHVTQVDVGGTYRIRISAYLHTVVNCKRWTHRVASERENKENLSPGNPHR